MKNTLIVFFVLLFAFSILGISFFRSASVTYDFSDVTQAQAQNVLGESTAMVEYYLPYPGRVLTDSVFWPLKAMRDKAWLWVTTKPTRKAELKLLFADKRLGMAKILFENGKPEVGYTTLTKAEKYLEEAQIMEEINRKNGYDTSDFLEKIATSSLKHFEIMEHLVSIAPEDAKPVILSLEGYPKKTYEHSRDALLEKKMAPPENPFDW